jgi:hypothetical protein
MAMTKEELAEMRREDVLDRESYEYHRNNLAKVLPAGSTAIHSWHELHKHAKAVAAALDAKDAEIERLRSLLQLEGENVVRGLSAYHQKVAVIERIERERDEAIDKLRTAEWHLNDRTDGAMILARERDAAVAEGEATKRQLGEARAEAATLRKLVAGDSVLGKHIAVAEAAVAWLACEDGADEGSLREDVHDALRAAGYLKDDK